MLASATVSEEFAAWNKKWGAPFGRRLRPWRLIGRLETRIVNLSGPFAFQGNSITRTFEYPWAYHVLPRTPGVRLLEIGGALSGLQFVLAKEGAEVHNVDPLWDYGSGAYDSNLHAKHAAINRRYGTQVQLHQSTLQTAADLEKGFDAVYSVSTIEHMKDEDIASTLALASDLLRPGGLVVLTVDLFLNVRPFCTRDRNLYGSNVSIAWIQECLNGFDLIGGEKRELFGYPEFSADYVSCNLESFLMNGPQLAQVVAFRKPGP